MTDLWDEKPESEQWGKFKYPVKRGEALKVTVYDAEEMDAWLEKVIDNYTKELCWQQERFVKVNDKLEAIKTWLIEAKAQGRISMSVGFSLDEILGVEE